MKLQNKKDIATVVVEMYYRTAELPDVTNHLLINYRTKQSGSILSLNILVLNLYKILVILNLRLGCIH